MISLFVRSYPGDFNWLAHSVKSMSKNLHNISEKILVVPASCTYIPTYIRNFFDNIHFVHETHEGYIQQQIDKVRAYKYCSSDYILFSDSDCIYYNQFDAEQKLQDGKVLLPKTRYELVESAIIWKEITYMTTGIMPDYEYMRCFPIMHHREVLEWLDSDNHYNSYLSVVKNRELSEFNALGIIAETHFKHRYIFLDTETTDVKIQTAKQYWSWGGITKDIRQELRSV